MGIFFFPVIFDNRLGHDDDTGDNNDGDGVVAANNLC